jgi:uncharacterized membrane protein YbaN (DUF454 family)
MIQERHIQMSRTSKRRHAPRTLIRRVLGWGTIALGLLGIVLPVLPGLIFIAIGVVLLGPHDPALRRSAIAIRLILRRWSQCKQRHFRQLGRFARSRYREQRLLLRAQLHHHEHGEQGWRGHYMLLAITLAALAITAGIGFFVWHTIL